MVQDVLARSLVLDLETGPDHTILKIGAILPGGKSFRGEPEILSREHSGEALEAERQRLETLLDDLTLQAEAAAGASDVARPSGD